MIRYHPIIMWLDIADGRSYTEIRFCLQHSIFGLELTITCRSFG